MCDILYDFDIFLLQERTDDKKKVFQLAAGKKVKAILTGMIKASDVGARCGPKCKGTITVYIC